MDVSQAHYFNVWLCLSGHGKAGIGMSGPEAQCARLRLQASRRRGMACMSCFLACSRRLQTYHDARLYCNLLVIEDSVHSHARKACLSGIVFSCSECGIEVHMKGS